MPELTPDELRDEIKRVLRSEVPVYFRRPLLEPTDNQLLVWDETNTRLAFESSATFAAHNLLDGGTLHSDTATDGVSRGSLVVGDAAGTAWDELVIGASARLFQSDGSDPSWVAVSGDATIAAGGAVTVAGTHSGSAHHSANTTATESAEGIVELATTAELTAATADRAAALANLAAQVQSGTWTYKADTAADDTYLVAMTPTLGGYTKGQVVQFEAQTVNTGACTLNIDSLGAKAIKKNHDVDPANGDIEANQIVTVVYDGTNFQMQSQLGNAGAGVTFGTPALVLGTTAAAGSTDEAIRLDSQIIAFDATVPVTQAHGDSAAAGSAAIAARRDHVHGMPAAGNANVTFAVTVLNPTVSNYAIQHVFANATMQEIQTAIVGGTSVTFDPYPSNTSRSGTSDGDFFSAPEAADSATSKNHSISGTAAFIADSWILLNITAVSGAVTEFDVVFRFTYD